MNSERLPNAMFCLTSVEQYSFLLKTVQLPVKLLHALKNVLFHVFPPNFLLHVWEFEQPASTILASRLAAVELLRPPQFSITRWKLRFTSGAMARASPQMKTTLLGSDKTRQTSTPLAI